MAFWDPDFWVSGYWIQDFWEGDAPVLTTAITTGTAINVPEATIVSTGGTVIITLSDDTFIAAGTGPIGTLAQSDAFVQAMLAATSPTNGWNNEVAANLDNTDLVRTSATEATITIPATAAYAPGLTETITPVIQAAILVTSVIDVNSSQFQITAASGGLTLVRDVVRDVVSDVTRSTIQ